MAIFSGDIAEKVAILRRRYLLENSFGRSVLFITHPL
jgi:hypothetical protein